MVNLQLIERFTQEMQDQEKITDYENGINDQLDQKCAERFGRFLFHAFQILRVGTRSRSCGIIGKSKFCCSCRRLWRQNRCVAIPIALTIAGSDSSAGAGIQADLKTFAALGVYGTSAITAITAQNTTGVSAVSVLSADLVTAQIETVVADLRPSATKTGMLASSAIVEAVAAAIVELDLPLVVVDPVLVAKSGDRLLDEDALNTIRDELIPRAFVVTPNIPEAEALTNRAI